MPLSAPNIAHNIPIPVTHVEREIKKALLYRFLVSIPKLSDVNLAEISREEMMRCPKKNCRGGAAFMHVHYGRRVASARK